MYVHIIHRKLELLLYLDKLVIQQKTANLAFKCNQFISISNLNLSGFDILKPISYFFLAK